MTEPPKRECLIVVTTGLLLIISGCLLFSYKLPNLISMIEGLIIILTGSIILVAGKKLYINSEGEKYERNTRFSKEK